MLKATVSTNNADTDIESSRWSSTWRHRHSIFVWARLCRWCRPTTWIVLSIVLSILIIILTPVSIRYTASPADYTGHFAPIDTRIIPVSNTLCQGLKLAVSKALSGYNASLYMLDSHPTLTEFMFTIPVGYLELKAEEYHYYYFYMNPGSNFTVSVCKTTSTRYHGLTNFYVLKGQSEFKDWQNEPFEYDGDGIYALCSEDNDIFTYQVTSEDYYYLVFSAEYNESVDLIIQMTFYRTLYMPVLNESTNTLCSTSVGTDGDSCAVDVPLFGKTAFIFVVPQSGTDVNWETGVDLDVICVLMYSVITLSVLVGLMVSILTFVTIKYRKKIRGVVETDEMIENSSLLPKSTEATYGSTPPI